MTENIMQTAHGYMPSFLSNYDVYLDIKIVNGQLLESLSKTGLQALAVFFMYLPMTYDI